jgi:GNAT superfamily N-acetyltransferase
MQIRPLTPEDVEGYRALRLEALENHPTAYVSDLTEEAALDIEALRQRLTASEAGITFGAWDAERLVGIGTLVRPERLRLRFRAMVVGMYVVPDRRGQGIARKLLAACVDRVRGLSGVEEVCLCITVGNDSARRVYEAFGFESDYIEPRYFKYEGRYYDLEWMRLPLD